MPLCLTLMSAVAAYSSITHVLHCECEGFTSHIPPWHRCGACRIYYKSYRMNLKVKKFYYRHVRRCRGVTQAEIRNRIFLNRRWCYSCDHHMRNLMGERFYLSWVNDSIPI